MGNYTFDKPKEPKKDAGGRRGIGCLLMIVLPAISYPGAFFLLAVPTVRRAIASFMGKFFIQISLPKNLYHITFMQDIWRWIEAQNSLLVTLILGTLILLMLYSFFSILFALMLRTVSPKRYGPTDAPPQKRSKKRKKYSR